MEENQEVQIATVENPEIVYQQDKATIDMQIATAKAYPRNIKRSMENAIATVTINKESAASCTYALPRGGKAISGPSVHLAKILAQTWGNLRVEAKVVDIGAKTITSQAVAFDLENNLAIKVEVKRSIVGRSGRFNDDMITMTGNAANAIALRNAVFNVIPRGVLDEVWGAAKRKVTGDLSDEDKLIAGRKKVFDEFRDTFKVTEEEVLTAIGKPAITTVTSDDLVILIGIRQALIDGDTSVDDAFRSGSKKQVVEVNAKEKEEARIKDHIEKAKTLGKLEEAEAYVDALDKDHILRKLYNAKADELAKKE